MPPINADASAQLLCIIIIGKGLECAIKLWSHSIFNMKKKISDFSEKELLEKILSILAGKEDSPVRAKQVCTRQLYSNKELMDLLQVKDRYLKKLRDNGYIGYSREGTSSCANSIMKLLPPIQTYQSGKEVMYGD